MYEAKSFEALPFVVFTLRAFEALAFEALFSESLSCAILVLVSSRPYLSNSASKARKDIPSNDFLDKFESKTSEEHI